MGFEDNPADNEHYERDLAYAEIATLKKEIEQLNNIILTHQHELAELRADDRSRRNLIACNDKFHWELVDLFDREARGMSPLHFVKEKIQSLQAREKELVDLCRLAYEYIPAPNDAYGNSVLARLKNAIHPPPPPRD